jgi:hypothetical protein
MATVVDTKLEEDLSSILKGLHSIQRAAGQE